MHMTDVISLLLLISFTTGYILKLVLLKKRDKINANVLAKGNKGFAIFIVEMLAKVFSLLWVATWLAEIVFHNEIASIIGYLFTNTYIKYIGLILSAFGVGIFYLAIIFMKNSWRVGIDKNTKTTLITSGIYKFSRNPAFLGFDFMFVGLFATYYNIFTLIIMVANITSFHLLILQEEKHLQAMFGDEYTKYKRRVPRYFLIF